MSKLNAKLWNIHQNLCFTGIYRKEAEKEKKNQQKWAKAENEVCHDILQLCRDISCEEYK